MCAVRSIKLFKYLWSEHLLFTVYDSCAIYFKQSKALQKTFEAISFDTRSSGGDVGRQNGQLVPVSWHGVRKNIKCYSHSTNTEPF